MGGRWVCRKVGNTIPNIFCVVYLTAYISAFWPDYTHAWMYSVLVVAGGAKEGRHYI